MEQIISSLKQDLKNRIFDQGVHWRILFIGTSVNGTTDIVSSLSRSLRNLGHHVLDIDTRRHKILDNPFGRQGGMGPIFVKYESISQMVDEFRPQMIICCAGGLTFTEEDANLLKNKGITLIGITLSDPDVLPSIVKYQHVFDVHTTNSVEALEMYKEQGLNNTVYFPFGIDRGFITQDVPEASEFEADVICLGHATQRPDRNSMMNFLDERFDVRTYGRGWEIPNSITVSGNSMVQALQGGKIHVNFPLTRAGYINIKCGVFESASQGRVVATGIFPEMEQFFEYGEEIVGYNDEADLAEKISYLLDNPKEYERIALNGFRRIINEHLYEHRWMSLFDAMMQISGDAPGWLTPKRAAEIHEILQNSLPRAKKVILSGFYGARNLGDEMILRSISKSLTAYDSSVQVVVASESPLRVEAQHGLQSFERKNHDLAGDEVKTASAVLLGGGGLWHDYTFERGGGISGLFNGGKISIAGFAALPMMGRVLGIPFHVVGLGVGPLGNSDAKRTVKFVAEQASSIYVRDSESERLLKEIGVSENLVSNAPDAVYAIDLEGLRHEKDQVLASSDDTHQVYLGLNLRPWSGYDMASATENIVTALNQFNKKIQKDKKKLVIIPLPMQGGQGIDIAAISEVTKSLDSTILVHDRVSNEGLTISEFLTLLDKCSVVISMRLHAALIAHRSQVPVVGLCYDPKVTRHFDEVSRSAYGLELSSNSDQLIEAISNAYEEGLSKDTITAIKGLEAEANAAMARMARLVADSTLNDRVYEIPRVQSHVNPMQNRTRIVDANYRNLTMKSSSTEIAGNTDIGVHEVVLSLNTEFPKKGNYVEYNGEIRLTKGSSTTLYISLESDYENPRSLNALFANIEISNFKFRTDLAESKEPVQLAFNTPGASVIPFSFRVSVERDLFKARSWERATTVKLRLHETIENLDSSIQKLIATRGKVLQR